MTNGIRASGFLDMVAADITAYSSYPIQNPNPNFYDPYRYTSSIYQYTPPPTPPHVYHHIQPPPEPPFHFYNSSQTPYITTSPMLVTDNTKCFLHQLDNKVTQLDVKLTEIRMIIEEKKRVAEMSSLDDVFVGSSEACEGSFQNQNSIELEATEKWEDKRTQIIQTLEKMQKSLAKLSTPVKEMSSSTVNQSSNTPAPVSVVDSPDVFCGVKKIINDNSEGLNQLELFTPSQNAPELFDASPETDFIAFAVKSSERAMKRDFVNHFAEDDMTLNHKLHENEYGKFFGKFGVKLKNKVNATLELDGYNGDLLVKGLHYHVKFDLVERLVDAGRCFLCLDGDIICYKNLHEDEYGKLEVPVESSKHIIASELLEKGIGFVISLNCFCGDGSLCKTVCLDSMSGQLDEVPQEVLVDKDIVSSNEMKEFILEKLCDWFCYKSQDDVPSADCFTIQFILVAINCYFTLLKGQEIHAYPLKHVILVELAVQCFSKMLKKNSVPFKSLFARLCEIGRRSVAWDLFNTMSVNTIDFTMVDIVNTYRLLMEIWIHDEIQISVINICVGLNDFIELTLIELYSRCCKFDCTASISKKVPEHVLTSLDAVIIVVSLSNESGNCLKFYCWLKTNDVPPNNAPSLNFLDHSEAMKPNSELLKLARSQTKNFYETIGTALWTLTFHSFNAIRTVYDKKLLVPVQPYTPSESERLHFAIRWALASRFGERHALIKLPGHGKIFGEAIFGRKLSGEGVINQKGVWVLEEITRVSCRGNIQNSIVFILEDKDGLNKGQFLIIYCMLKMTLTVLINNLIISGPSKVNEIVEPLQAGTDQATVIELMVFGFHLADYVVSRAIISTKHVDDENCMWKSTTIKQLLSITDFLTTTQKVKDSFPRDGALKYEVIVKENLGISSIVAEPGCDKNSHEVTADGKESKKPIISWFSKIKEDHETKKNREKIHVAKGTGKGKWNHYDIYMELSLILQPLAELPLWSCSKNSILSTTANLGQRREAIILKQVKKGMVSKIKKAEHRIFGWYGSEHPKTFTPATMFIIMFISAEMRAEKGAHAELATNAKVVVAKKNMKLDTTRKWNIRSSYMQALVKAEYKISLNCILEDKDVLKEWSMSRIGLIWV